MATKGRTKTTQTPCGKFKKGSPKHTECMAKIAGKTAASGVLGGMGMGKKGRRGTMKLTKHMHKMTPAEIKEYEEKKKN